MSHNHLDRLHKMLLEDTGSVEEADQMLETVQKINQLPRPNPVHRSTANLIQLLSKELPDPKPTLLEKLRDWYPLLLLRSQIRIVSREIWLGSGMVFLLGIIVTLSETNDLGTDLTPLTIIAPIVAMVGIALLYDTNIEPLFEIEDASPLGVPLLLLARLTLLFSFDLGLGLFASLILAAIQPDLSLLPLIMSWLVPMTFLSALAFFTSIFARNSIMGMIAGLGIWILHLAFRSGEDLNRILYTLSLPGMADPGSRALFLLISGILVSIALIMASNTERRIGVAS